MGLANASEEIAAKFIYTQGCYQAIKEDVENVVVALGVTTLILGLIQVSFSLITGVTLFVHPLLIGPQNMYGIVKISLTKYLDVHKSDKFNRICPIDIILLILS